jgi:MFS family permease
MSLALFLPGGFYDATLDRYLTDMGASNRLISIAFLAYGIPFALLATTGGRLADRHGPLRMAFASILLVGPLTAAYGFIDVAIVVVVVSGIEGCIQALGVPASQAIVAEGAPRGRAAAAQGLSGSGNLLIGAATGYIAGPMYAAVGPRWMYPIAGMGVVLFGVLALAQRERRTAANEIS